MAEKVPTKSGNPYHDEHSGEFVSPGDTSQIDGEELDDKQKRVVERMRKLMGIQKEEPKAIFEENPINKQNDLDNPYGFKRIIGEHSYEDDTRKVNPNYSLGREYQINCQRCVPTYEMRRRGFDVEALPRRETWDHLARGGGMLKIFKDVKTSEIMSKRKNKVQDELTNVLKSYGPGSRIAIRIGWDYSDRMGHVFIGENINGEIHFIDPQNGKTDVSSYFSYMKLSGFNKSYYYRIDNLEPAEYIKECCK